MKFAPGAGPSTSGSFDDGLGSVAWFHCFAGIAGDMALASLLDAGADEAVLRESLGRLPLEGWSLEVTRVVRAGMVATRADVRVQDGGPARRLADLIEVVERADLPARVLQRSTAAFSLLASVEGAIHGQEPDEVHFHELGGHDTIIDVVGTMAALELLGVDRVTASPIAAGTGTIASAHGIIPNPSPAVLAIMAGAPIYGRDLDLELTTPTGAAILSSCGATYGPLPPLVVRSVGYGAGSRDLDSLPNVTQVVLGDRAPAPIGSALESPPVGQPLLVLETNLDDVTGEELADAVAVLLASGAKDAWLTPVTMKKGRPGHVLSALCDLGEAPMLRQLMFRHTGTLGVRGHLVERRQERRQYAGQRREFCEPGAAE